jgi:hypothetical protein
MAVNALAALKERTMRMEASKKRARARDRASKDMIIGSVSAVAAATLAGFVDGKLDLLNDEKEGDGVTVMGLPVMPLGATAITLGGLAMGGRAGSIAVYAGVGISSGWAYSAGMRRGMK